MTNKAATEIHKVFQVIPAFFPIPHKGAAIKATTAGRIPLNTRSTSGLSLNSVNTKAINKITIKENSKNIDKNTINIMVDGLEVYISLEGLIDIKEEIERLSQEKNKMLSEIARCEKMLSNPGFVNKAPKAKVEEEQRKLENYKELLNKIETKLNEYK